MNLKSGENLYLQYTLLLLIHFTEGKMLKKDGIYNTLCYY